MIARTIAAVLASVMCLSIANAATNTTLTRVPAFAVYDASNMITMDPAAFTTPLAGCCLQWTMNNTAFQNFSSYATVTSSNNIHCSNATEPYEFPITSSRFNAGVYAFHYDCWNVNATKASAGDQLNVRITLGQQQNSTGSSGNTSSSTGSAVVNATSSTGVSGNTTQPSVNASSSTGVSGNATATSSTGVSGNITTSSTGVSVNATASSSGVSGNATAASSSTGVSGNATVASSSSGRVSSNATQSSTAPAGLSSSSGEGAWLSSSSSSGSVIVVSSSASLIVRSSSTGVRVNETSSTGTVGNATSSTGTRGNATSSSSAGGNPDGSVSSSSVPAPVGNPPNTMAARFEIEINGTTVPENLKTLIRNDLCNVVAQQFNTTFEVVNPFCLVDVGAPVPAARRLLANRVPITFTLLGNITSVVDTTGGAPASSPLAAVNFIKQAIQTGTPILTTATSNLGIVVPVQTVVVEDLSPQSSSTGVEGPAPEDSSSSGLSGGAIAGIIIGVLAGVAILGFVGYAAFAGKFCFKGTASVGVAHATTTPVQVKGTKDAEVV